MTDDSRDATAAPAAPSRGGFFAKVKRGLFMTHTEILEKLGTAVKKGLGIDESVLESLEETLLSADVGADTAAALTEAVRERAGRSERKDLAALRSMLLAEIEALLASAPRPPRAPDAPLYVVFLVGVNGSGKTTTTAKLAAREKAAGRSVVLAAADTFRAGAIEQLQTWADRLGLSGGAAPRGRGPVRRPLRRALGGEGPRRADAPRRHRGTSPHEEEPDGGAREDAPHRGARGPRRPAPDAARPGRDDRESTGSSRRAGSSRPPARRESS